MHIGCFQQFFAHRFSGPTFKEHIVRDYHSRHAGWLEHGADVLHKVQLLVGGSGPEVLAVIGKVFLFLLAFFVGKGLTALLSESGFAGPPNDAAIFTLPVIIR